MIRAFLPSKDGDSSPKSEYNHLSIDNYKSAEIAFAKYVRFCGERLKEIENLDKVSRVNIYF